MKYYFLCFVITVGCVFPKTNEDNKSSISETDIWAPIIENRFNYLIVKTVTYLLQKLSLYWIFLLNYGNLK